MAAELDGYIDINTITNPARVGDIQVESLPPPQVNPEFEARLRQWQALGNDPAVMAVADPVQQLQRAAAGNPEIQQVVDQTLGGAGGIGALASFGDFGKILAAHRDRIVSDGTRIFRAINEFFQPGRSQEPSRCATVGDFIGTVQGRYNSTLSSITGALGELVGAIVSIPARIIGAFTSAVSGLIGAVVAGIRAPIQLAVGALRGAVGLLTGAIGAANGLISQIGAGISQVTGAVSREAQNITTALTSGFSRGFSRSVSGVNPCVAAAQSGAPVAQMGVPPT
jgi:hypothetical protein